MRGDIQLLPTSLAVNKHIHFLQFGILLEVVKYPVKSLQGTFGYMPMNFISPILKLWGMKENNSETEQERERDFSRWRVEFQRWQERNVTEGKRSHSFWAPSNPACSYRQKTITETQERRARNVQPIVLSRREYEMWRMEDRALSMST